MIQPYYCKEKLDTGHSQGIKDLTQNDLPRAETQILKQESPEDAN